MNANEGGVMFLHPERTIGRLDVKKGMTVADFGAGSGFFTIALARLVGESGKVYAIDIQKFSLDLIKSKAHIENLLNIETVWADLELPQGSHLPAESVDLVVISNILFQSEKKLEVMREAYRVLKPQGRIAVIEWDETPFAGGPPAEMRIAKRAAQSLLGQAGFILDREFEAGSHHYGLLYRK
ncbi:MAG: methyltransferase domain-containing protein [Candidatus Sungiibacteriota bacterium]